MANATNPASGAGNSPSLSAIMQQAGLPAYEAVLKKYTDAIFTEENAKAFLASIGKPITPEAVQEFRRGSEIGQKLQETFMQRAYKRREAVAENKGEGADPQTIAIGAVKAFYNPDKIIQKLDMGAGSCDQCGEKAYNKNVILQRCSRCKEAMYCSKECQKAHWPTHKQVCKLP